MKTNVILSSSFPAWVVPVLIVGIFGVIVLIVILLKKHVKLFQSHEQPKSDKEVAAEELDRLLEPVEDPEAKKQMADYDKKDSD